MAVMGNQTPTLMHEPIWEPNVRNVGREAVELAAAVGLILDPWEAMILEKALTPRNETYYNKTLKIHLPKNHATQVGVMVSRQNGKGAILEALELACLFLLGDEVVFHTAHEFKTAREAFKRVSYWIKETPWLSKEVLRICYNHGEEGIEMKNGQRLLFASRATKGGGRGFTGSKVIFDEAMILKRSAMPALVPTLSAVPNPQLWFLGSAGDEESDQFGRVRRNAIKAQECGPDGKDWNNRLLYFEWSADVCNEFCQNNCPDHEPWDEPETWAKCNPGYGIRLSEEWTRTEMATLSKEDFKRERLGVGTWPSGEDDWNVIPEGYWQERENAGSIPKAPFVLAVDVTPDGISYSCIAVCAEAYGGKQHVEITSTATEYDHRPGTDWVIPRLVELSKGLDNAPVVIDKATQAGRFVDELEYHGVEVLVPNTREYAQACGAFYTSVVPKAGNNPNLVHVGQPMLSKAVAGATKRELSELWAWDKKESRSDISPIVAATLAKWGYMKVTTEKQPVAPWIDWR
jgi:phage terminase large subunit-like protein